MKKILLVDDHSDIRQLMRLTLGKNYEVLEADDGVSALAVTQNMKPDLVILDIMMPGPLDGYMVLERIRADPKLKDIRVIMVTARGQAKDYDAGMSRGADAYFIKPFSPMQLTQKIREFLP
jgi:CheY-like chemotaxis protein